ncbi:MAG: hypothetical protein QOH69_1969 [Actinomycetota bacterium]|jgi:hypothetical protein|nr:hypothetical protein [Actinomycetota bacterium]
MKRTPLALAAVLALGLALAPALSAVAADAPPKAPAITWSVQASGPTGNDGRLSFAYGVDPGTEIDDFVAVSNRGTAKQTFTIYGTDAINQFDSGAFSLLPAAQKPHDVGSWITTKTAKITVPAGQTAIIPFTILVPSDATPGDHTGGVIASVTTAAPGKKSGVGIDQRVAARVYLRVSGQPVAKVVATGVVAGFTPVWNPFGGGGAAVDYDVRNNGNVREDVAQSIEMSGPFGIGLGKITGKPLLNLLPGQSTHIHETVAGVFPLVLLFANVKLTPSAPTDLVGQSQLRDQNGKLLPASPEPKFTAVTTSALAAAISWTLLAIVLVLIALIFLISRYVRNTRERMFDAIDAATAEAQRAAQARSATPAKETVSAGAPEPRS